MKEPLPKRPWCFPPLPWEPGFLLWLALTIVLGAIGFALFAWLGLL